MPGCLAPALTVKVFSMETDDFTCSGCMATATHALVQRDLGKHEDDEDGGMRPGGCCMFFCYDDIWGFPEMLVPNNHGFSY